MDPVLINGVRMDKDRTEVEARADADKRNADNAALELARIQRMQHERLFGGLK